MAASLAGYYFKKSRDLEILHHQELLRDQIQNGMEHFSAPSGQAAVNSSLLMNNLRKIPPDTARIYAIINDIAQIQKKLQRSVIDTVILKIAGMTDSEKQAYLNGFESWLSRFRQQSRNKPKE
jgi:hypothetical protein